MTRELQELPYKTLCASDLLDSKLVTRATRLVAAYMVSLVLLIGAIVAGYVVLREEMSIQSALSEANTHINVIHRTTNESVSLLLDFREAAAASEPNARLVQVIERRINKTIDELDTRSRLLTATMNKLEGTTHWEDFKWINSTSNENQNVLLDRFVGQMRELVNRREELEQDGIRPQIPAEAAGARHGALSNEYRKASEQLPKIITRHSNRVEDVHQVLTFLILGMFFLVSVLIVLPLWQRLIREHKRHEQAHEKLHQFAYIDQETGLPNLDGLERNIMHTALPSGIVFNQFLILVRIRNLDEIYNLIGSQEIVCLHHIMCERLKTSALGKQIWSRSSESEYATVIAHQLVAESDEWVEQFINELSKPVKIAGILVRPIIALAVSQLENSDAKGGCLLREHQANARMALPLFDHTALNLPAYEISLTRELTKQNELITAITGGIKNKQFVPFYQIKVDATSGNSTSMEVLCRWLRADGTIVAPDKFIPAAERSGQIVPMTYQLLEHVVCDVRQWFSTGFHVGPVAINVSAEVLQHKDFIGQISHVREALLAARSDLEIEVTENVAIEDSMGMTRRVLQQLRDRGVRIAIDDFGIGYASLQTLIDLPFDVLKIDRSFVNTMSESGAGSEVVSAMISLCSKLNKQSVIEGVELEWQWHQLARMGADELQGFFFHKPACADDVSDWLEYSRSWRAAS